MPKRGSTKKLDNSNENNNNPSDTCHILLEHNESANDGSSTEIISSQETQIISNQDTDNISSQTTEIVDEYWIEPTKEVDENFLRENDKISKKPLHLAYYSTFNISSKELKRLSGFYKIKRGRWSQKETQRLMKNWTRVQNRHPEFADSRIAFSGLLSNNDNLDIQEMTKMKKRYDAFHLLLRLAYKLKYRLICDIYFKSRKMFYYTNFKYHHRRDVNRELVDLILNDVAAGESITIIADRYDVSPDVIETIRRRPHKTAVPFKWSKEAIKDLEIIISHRFNTNNIEDKSIGKADWSAIANEMQMIGYKVGKEQCYNKWIRFFRGRDSP